MPEQRELVDALVAFAKDPATATFSEVPFVVEDVILALGEDSLSSVATSSLVDPTSWELEPTGGFAGYDGPFSALRTLREAQSLDVRAGEHRKCASPPTPPPVEAERLTQVSIEPAGIDSCVLWFAVDLFLDQANHIAVVRLDLFEP